MNSNDKSLKQLDLVSFNMVQHTYPKKYYYGSTQPWFWNLRFHLVDLFVFNIFYKNIYISIFLNIFVVCYEVNAIQIKACLLTLKDVLDNFLSK